MSIEILFWIAAYILYLLVMAWSIVGIRLAAEGATEILPDGSEQDGEMFLYPLYKELHRFEYRKVFYRDKQLTLLMQKILKSKLLPPSVNLDWHSDLIRTYTAESKELLLGLEDYLKVHHGVSIEVAGETTFRLYREVKDYHYSKYVRKPVIGCVTCMPSLWSVFMFGIPMLTTFGFHAWIFQLWLWTIPALSFLTTTFYKKAK